MPPILIIEEEISIQKNTRTYLEGAGNRVMCMANGPVALISRRAIAP